MKKICIDASVFLGMNSSDNITRISCKNFFIENNKEEILMNFEQVGICDNIIWSFPFKLQSLYYPFMDLFHTIMPIKKMPYTTKTIKELEKGNAIKLTEKLNIAFAKEHDAIIYSIHFGLFNKSDSVIKVPNFQEEKKFSRVLEKYYQRSLKLSLELNTFF